MDLSKQYTKAEIKRQGCPICEGKLVLSNSYYKCNDCDLRFRLQPVLQLIYNTSYYIRKLTYKSYLIIKTDNGVTVLTSFNRDKSISSISINGSSIIDKMFFDRLNKLLLLS